MEGPVCLDWWCKPALHLDCFFPPCLMLWAADKGNTKVSAIDREDLTTEAWQKPTPHPPKKKKTNKMEERRKGQKNIGRVDNWRKRHKQAKERSTEEPMKDVINRSFHALPFHCRLFWLLCLLPSSVFSLYCCIQWIILLCYMWLHWVDSTGSEERLDYSRVFMCFVLSKVFFEMTVSQHRNKGNPPPPRWGTHRNPETDLLRSYSPVIAITARCSTLDGWLMNHHVSLLVKLQAK